MKGLVLFIAFFIFTSCSYKQKDVFSSFNLKKQEELDSCVRDSYKAYKEHKKYALLVFEKVELNQNCSWNISARSAFEEQLFLFFKDIKQIEVISKDFQEFITYKIDNKYYLKLIYINEGFSDYFILDYKGLYAQELIQNFDKNYKNIYINKINFDKKYTNSIIKMNFLYKYFQREYLFEF